VTAVTTVAVVGAGIAGLAAAWQVQQAGVAVTVLESERRTGGVIVTERRDGFIVEGGPDGFLGAEPDLPELAREGGIGERLVDQAARGTAVWTGSRFEPLAEGSAAALLGIEVRGEELGAGFRSFEEGMGQIVAALVAQLGPAVRSAAGVTGIAPSGRGYRLALTGGSAVAADAVILALPAFAAARLLAALGVSAARELGALVYHPSVTVSLAYRSDQVAAPLSGTGFVVAASSPGVVRACTYASAKYPGRAPAGHVLLRAFLTPADGEPGALAHAELAPLLRLNGAPLWTRAFHWPRALPRYPVHHAAHVAAVRERLARLAPLAICGAGYDGAGVSACVRSGREAAREVVRRLGG
jgi:oxygen-dependent protoporphyrinogen oxidase